MSEVNDLPLRSTIFDGNGKMLGTVYEVNRSRVTFSAVPQHVRDAFVAAEDERFWTHDGVDAMAIGRAFLANLRSGQKLQGGSTITMQLAKLMFAEPLGRRTVEQKIFEARAARDLEERYSKKQILTMYLNRAYFGSRAYGLRSAAEAYFGKKVKDLSIAEGALLAGLVKAPSTLNPFKFPKQSLNRRGYVLGRMLFLGMIDEAQHEAATQEELNLKPKDYLQRIAKPYWVEYIEREALESDALGLTEEERARLLYRGGLKVRTTLNPRWQKWAEQAVKEALPYESDPEAALVAIDIRTGAIKAMVGGRDFFKDQFDIASQGLRQPGSAFKPFVMAAALEQGISPESRYASAPTTIDIGGGQKWKVDNYDSRDRGILSLRSGMIGSVNGVYARLMMKVGPKAVVDVAKRLGIRKARLDPYPALALGGLTYGVTPLELASAYATIAANGAYYPPHGIATVTDANGKTLFDQTKLVPEQAMDPNLAYTLTDVLQDVACCGTGVRAKLSGIPMAAKTGTTQELKDAWLVGYTAHIATAVWVGYRKPKPMFNVRGIKVVGGTFPSQIWRTFMSKVEAEFPIEDFENPPGVAALRLVNGSKERCRRSGGVVATLDPDSELRACPSASPSQSESGVPSPTSTQPPSPKPTDTKPPKPSPKPTPTRSPSPTPTSTPSETTTPTPTSTATHPPPSSPPPSSPTPSPSGSAPSSPSPSPT
ncbi:MAG: transglycosylase domain-containing protein [Actinomycetota bacterium]